MNWKAVQAPLQQCISRPVKAELDGYANATSPLYYKSGFPKLRAETWVLNPTEVPTWKQPAFWRQTDAVHIAVTR